MELMVRFEMYFQPTGSSFTFFSSYVKADRKERRETGSLNNVASVNIFEYSECSEKYGLTTITKEKKHLKED